jgi:transcriptional regulator of acetoin/glycerol metabolism
VGSSRLGDKPNPDQSAVSPSQITPSHAPASKVAAARDAFLRDEAVPRGIVRQPILASWVRSAELLVEPASPELGHEASDYRQSPLLRLAAPIIDTIAMEMGGEPMSIILCDDEGVVLARRTGDTSLQQQLDRVWLTPGFSYAERYVGTNGIGTALESLGPAHVFGHEHFVEPLGDLACAGAPIRHPVTGKLLGVLDLTCWRRDANPFMITAASMLAHRIEEALLRQTGRRELTLLHDYLTACHRNRGAVLAVSDDLLMLNDQARALLDPGDQAPLVAAAMDALASGRAQQIVVDLPSGTTARLHCRPSWPDDRSGAGVLRVQMLAEDADVRAPGAGPLPGPMPAVVGSGTLWNKCVGAVTRQARHREWLNLAAEPGSGRRTLLRAVHGAEMPATHLRLLDAADYDARWLAELIDELEEGGAGTIVLADVDALPADALQVLAEVLEPHRESTGADRPWLVATTGGERVSPELTALLTAFPRTVRVPPLRHHIEDVPELVRVFVARLTHGSDLTVSPRAMRVLMRYRWPGNVAQLHTVVRRIVAQRRAGVIDVEDLPAEIATTTRRVLTPLEAIECEAIIDALEAAGGDKAAAAGRLGVSRATVYRKVRDYGIAVPRPGTVPAVRPQRRRSRSAGSAATG